MNFRLGVRNSANLRSLRMLFKSSLSDWHAVNDIDKEWLQVIKLRVDFCAAQGAMAARVAQGDLVPTVLVRS